MKVNKINISKKIIRSPTKLNNLSKELKKKLKQDSPTYETNVTNFKKIKITPKKSKSKPIKNNLFIPTSLSNKPSEVTKDVVVEKLIETIKPSVVLDSTSEVKKPEEVKIPVEANNSDVVDRHEEVNKHDEIKKPGNMKKNIKKLSKSKKVSRKK